MICLKLRAKLTLIISLLTLVALAAATITGYTFARQQLQSGIQQELTAILNSHVNTLDGWLITKAKMLEITLGTIQSTDSTHQITKPALAGYQFVDKDFSEMYFGSAAGRMIAGKWDAPADYDPRTRPWYKAAETQNRLIFTNPYQDSITQQMALTIAMPVKDAAGQFQGAIGGDILLQTLLDDIKTINLHGSGYAYLLDSTGAILAHPDQELLAKNVFEADKLKALAPVLKQILSEDQGFTGYTDQHQDSLIVYQKVPSTGWTLALTVPADVVYQPLSKLKLLFAGIILLSIVVVISVTTLLVKRITKPVETLLDQVNQVAAGDLTVQATVSGQDEIAGLAAGFNSMVASLRSLILQVHTSAEQLAASTEQLTASSHESAQAANQVAGSITEIAQGAEVQLRTVEQTANSIDNISVNINRVTAYAHNAVAKSGESAEKAKDSNLSIAQAVHQMELIEQTVNTSAQLISVLGERSKEIGQIVDTISGIAGQTNLLALNAAIEAARAGEQGRGFAVVADEVRKLAEQSQTAAKQIAELVGQIQQDTTTAISAMDNGTHEVSLGAKVVTAAGDSYRQIAGLIAEISEQVAGISTAMEQVNKESQEIVTSMKTIDQLSTHTAAEAETVSAATQEQSASMEEVASASQNLAEMAQKLQAMVQQFRLQ
ncbi:methyl-accepting chemotaxis sensory transducer with Cache sensor [Dendrosporobacter quercicolus]|uniref:Methyl-accepting chemotaxis sensory transducer with Cache sensor n=1 Tax=Dendrosporobacter quercicolus TaxID=146817 RepID=A0A1G9Q6A4_9FIRM|nr:methyl-accepting chemotaxis sensory transducer with Cache sensor [Dendrosporobacter quercicolus]